jgi:hypothetical protein
MRKCVNFVFFLGLIISFSSVAQTPTKSGSQSVKKIKPPKLYTSLGIFKDSMVAPVDQVKSLIGNPLIVKDSLNQNYTITYYQVVYKRQALTEDEKTGKISPTVYPVVQNFTQTPLTSLWIKILKEELLPKEELYFMDIIVKDMKGNLFYAPNLKIQTKK